MSFAAGQVATALLMNRIQPVTYSAEMSGGTFALTTVQQDLPGCSITFTTATNNAIYIVTGDFEFNQVATTNNDAFGRCVVDGTTLTPLASMGGQVSGDRASVGRTWRGTLTTAGSHTIKLAGRATANTQYELNPTSTGMTLTIYEVVG